MPKSGHRACQTILGDRTFHGLNFVTYNLILRASQYTTNITKTCFRVRKVSCRYFPICCLHNNSPHGPGYEHLRNTNMQISIPITGSAGGLPYQVSSPLTVLDVVRNPTWSDARGSTYRSVNPHCYSFLESNNTSARNLASTLRSSIANDPNWQVSRHRIGTQGMCGALSDVGS